MTMRQSREIRRDYHKLLQSRQWFEYSIARIERAGKQCWQCGLRENLQVHHLIYYDVYPCQYSDSQTRVLCRECHERVHHLADLIWVQTLRFQPAELEMLFKRLYEIRPVSEEERATMPDLFKSAGELLHGLHGANIDGL